MTTLSQTLAIQTYSGQEWRMFAHIIRQLKAHGASYTTDALGNIYAQKGEGKNFPCVVAHMDTVHPIVEDLAILEAGDKLTGFNRVTMQQTGIGGDDKVGVFIALECLKRFDHIKAAFFVSEEVGCIGSDAADLDFFKDCRFVLQADRRGSSDFVTNASGVELSSPEFRKAVKPHLTKYGYKESTGAMTDVMTLKQNGLKVSCANFSCGYHRPHSADEYVSVSQVMRCLELFCAIIKGCTKTYKHTYTYKYTPPTLPSYSQTWKDYKPSYKPTQHATAYSNIKESEAGYCDVCSNYQKVVAFSAYWGCYMCDGCRKEWK